MTTGSVYRVAGGPPTAPTSERTTWVGAEAACEADGTHLAIPQTEAEHLAFVDVVAGASRWLGVTDRVTANAWIPVIGGTTWVAHWAGGAPGTGGKCVLLTCVGIDGEEATPCEDPDAQWHKGFICECDGQAADSTSY